MTQAISKPTQKIKLTFENYLTYDDGTDNRYELHHGELIVLPPESEENDFIAFVLRDELVQIVDRRRVRKQGCELQVDGEPQNRYPDLVVLLPEHIELMRSRQRLTITLDMPPPVLVVEVVSPGRTNRERDYVQKFEQYKNRGIPEYWIVDPEDRVVIVFQLQAGSYVEVGAFKGDDRMVSPTFPTLNLTADQVLNAD